MKPCHPIARFWAKVPLGPGLDECWEWNGARKSPTGYGNFWDGRHYVGAHVFSFQLEYGSVPDGLDVLHHCDNKPCVNPRHLYAGTKLQNAKDARERGLLATGARHGMNLHPESRPRGERSGTAKLSAEQVLQLRDDYASGRANQYELAAQLGMSQQHISEIVRRKRWSHI